MHIEGANYSIDDSTSRTSISYVLFSTLMYDTSFLKLFSPPLHYLFTLSSPSASSAFSGDFSVMCRFGGHHAMTRDKTTLIFKYQNNTGSYWIIFKWFADCLSNVDNELVRIVLAISIFPCLSKSISDFSVTILFWWKSCIGHTFSWTLTSLCSSSPSLPPSSLSPPPLFPSTSSHFSLFCLLPPFSTPQTSPFLASFFCSLSTVRGCWVKKTKRGH